MFIILVPALEYPYLPFSLYLPFYPYLYHLVPIGSLSLLKSVDKFKFKIKIILSSNTC